MYFFKKGGKQHMDLTGNLILSHNDELIKARQKSIAPVSAKNASYIEVGKLTTWGKLRASKAARKNAEPPRRFETIVITRGDSWVLN